MVATRIQSIDIPEFRDVSTHLESAEESLRQLVQKDINAGSVASIASLLSRDTTASKPFNNTGVLLAGPVRAAEGALEKPSGKPRSDVPGSSVVQVSPAETKFAELLDPSNHPGLNIKYGSQLKRAVNELLTQQTDFLQKLPPEELFNYLKHNGTKALDMSLSWRERKTAYYLSVGSLNGPAINKLPAENKLEVANLVKQYSISKVRDPETPIHDKSAIQFSLADASRKGAKISNNDQLDALEGLVLCLEAHKAAFSIPGDVQNSRESHRLLNGDCDVDTYLKALNDPTYHQGIPAATYRLICETEDYIHPRLDSRIVQKVELPTEQEVYRLASLSSRAAKVLETIPDMADTLRIRRLSRSGPAAAQNVIAEIDNERAKYKAFFGPKNPDYVGSSTSHDAFNEEMRRQSHELSENDCRVVLKLLQDNAGGEESTYLEYMKTRGIIAGIYEGRFGDRAVGIFEGVLKEEFSEYNKLVTHAQTLGIDKPLLFQQPTLLELVKNKTNVADSRPIAYVAFSSAKDAGKITGADPTITNLIKLGYRIDLRFMDGDQAIQTGSKHVYEQNGAKKIPVVMLVGHGNTEMIEFKGSDPAKRDDKQQSSPTAIDKTDAAIFKGMKNQLTEDVQFILLACEGKNLEGVIKEGLPSATVHAHPKEITHAEVRKANVLGAKPNQLSVEFKDATLFLRWAESVFN